MKMNEIVKETTASGIGVVVGSTGPMLSRQPKNPDGTAKNALDMGAKKKKRKSKKA